MEYLLKVSQYFGSFAKEFPKNHVNQIFDPNFHQVLDPCLNTPEEFNEVFSFEKFLIYVLPKI